MNNHAVSFDSATVAIACLFFLLLCVLLAAAWGECRRLRRGMNLWRTRYERSLDDAASIRYEEQQRRARQTNRFKVWTKEIMLAVVADLQRAKAVHEKLPASPAQQQICRELGYAIDNYELTTTSLQAAAELVGEDSTLPAGAAMQESASCPS